MCPLMVVWKFVVQTRIYFYNKFYPKCEENSNHNLYLKIKFIYNKKKLLK